MFAFIFQITIYAGTNEHSESGSHCIRVGEDGKSWTKELSAGQCHRRGSSGELPDADSFGKPLQKVPGNMRLTNGLHQSGFDFFLMALM